MNKNDISFDSIEGIHRDIEIAQKAMRKNPIQRIYPDALVIMEIYCIPSHNHHAFYLQLCEDIHNNIEVVTYARTEIYDTVDAIFCGYPTYPIYMYRFSDVLETQGKNRYSGKIVCGIINVDENLHTVFSEIRNALPNESRTNKENDGVMIDGVLHWVRYKKNGIAKEYRYCRAENLLTKSEYSAERAEILNIHNQIIERYF